MFCSHCGKTVKPDDLTCPSCGVVIGEVRFPGNSYTAAQPLVVDESAGDASELAGAAYTKTTYMTEGEQPEVDLSAQTTYRPLLDEDEAFAMDETLSGGPVFLTEPADEPGPAEPHDYQPDEDQPEDEPEDQSEEDPEDQPEEQAPAPAERPRVSGHTMEFEPIKRAGMSPKVRKYIERVEGKKAAKGELPDLSIAGLPDAREEDEDDYMSAAPSPNRRIITIVATSVAAVALVIVGIVLLGRLTNRANINGVTQSLYTAGVELMESRVTDEYRLAGVQSFVDGKFDDYWAEQGAAIDALLPETPAENDRLFVDAMQTINEAMKSSSAYDAMVYLGTNQVSLEGIAGERGDQGWLTARNAVTRLKAADTDAVLTSIVANVAVTLTTPTPEPETTDYSTKYQALRKGMNGSDDVKALQTRLSELGYFTDVIDGNFGSKTETAVKRFQNINGLPVDGVATSETQVAMYSDDAIRRPAVDPTPTPVPTATPAPTETPATSETPATTAPLARLAPENLFSVA